MQCPQCGNPNVTQKFCTRCGAAIPVAPAAEGSVSEYDPSFNPYESMARQRAASQPQPPPAPRPAPAPQPRPAPAPVREQSPPPPAGYKPAMGENMRSFITDPATNFQTHKPGSQLTAAIIMFVCVNVVQAAANFFFMGVGSLSAAGDPGRFLHKAAFTAGYPLAATLAAGLALAARDRALPDLRALFCIYALGFFPYLLSVTPLPLAALMCAALSVLHLRAGLAEAFGLEPAWLWGLSLGVPLAYWAAAGAAAGFRVLS